jgi:hypothetical protein
LHPPGTPYNLCHHPRKTLCSWNLAPHGIEGWYLAPSMNHCRCYQVWIKETMSECTADTLTWLPIFVTMPSWPAPSLGFPHLSPCHMPPLPKPPPLLHEISSKPYSTPHQPRHSHPLDPQHLYGNTPQLTTPIDTSTPLDPASITRLQEIIGTFLYYARAVDSTMLVSCPWLPSSFCQNHRSHHPIHNTPPPLLRHPPACHCSLPCK